MLVLVDRPTVQIYEERAQEWLERRPLADREKSRASGLAARVRRGAVRVDLGCGPGRHAGFLGRPLVALDAAHAMVALARQRHSDVLGVQADLARLPFRSGSLGGGWAACSYQHLAAEDLPMALAELHWALAVGAPVVMAIHGGEGQGRREDDDFPGRWFSRWSAGALADVVAGAGFDAETQNDGQYLVVTGQRMRSLPDTVGPGMRLLVCGLNPSVYAADAGFGYARPSNRFWKAAVESGLVRRPGDPAAALRDHGVGMTDLVKRATPRSAELSSDEYRDGADRVRRLVEWLQPGAICFVGLEGYRVAVDRGAKPGWQATDFGGRPAYVMPSTSGLNARSRPADVVAHLRAAIEGPPRTGG